MIVVGERSVGKTSLIRRAATGKFRERVQCTQGVHCETQINVGVFGGINTINLRFMDTTGAAEGAILVKTFLRNAHVIIFVYDVTNQGSYSAATQRVLDYGSVDTPNVLMRVLVGTKVDKVPMSPLAVDSEREVCADTGQRFAQRHRMHFTETSARDGRGVPEVFGHIARMLWQTSPPASSNQRHHHQHQQHG